MKHVFIVLGIFAAATCFFACGSEPVEDAQSLLSAEHLSRIKHIQQRIQKMRRMEIDFWTRCGPDPVHGGFYGHINRRGNGDPNADKGLIQQARHLITFTLLYRYIDNSPAIKSIADAQYRYLVDTFCDSNSQRFCSRVSADGTPKEDSKQLYAESFVIYSISLYALVFDNEEARGRVLACFRTMDEAMHDDIHGGYDQTTDHARRLAEGVGKETNTHMHLLESITALYEATGNPLVKRRLEEMIDVFCNKILQPDNYCHTVFTTDWTQLGDRKVEYGHDLQTAWLMTEAARVLGRADDPAIIDALTRMGVHSSKAGFDSAVGGYFYTGMLDGEITRAHKDWWVQAECLSGLWKIYLLTGESVHLDRMEKTLDWLDNNLIDHEFGGWYARIDPGKPPSGGGYKSDYWKSSYHSCRALILVDTWIEDVLRNNKPLYIE